MFPYVTGPLRAFPKTNDPNVFVHSQHAANHNPLMNSHCYQITDVEIGDLFNPWELIRFLTCKEPFAPVFRAGWV